MTLVPDKAATHMQDSGWVTSILPAAAITHEGRYADCLVVWSFARLLAVSHQHNR